MKNVLITPIAAIFILSACGPQSAEKESASGTASNVQAEAGAIIQSDTATDASNAAAKASVSLSGYVGKYPGDKVDGQRFLDNPLVKAAIRSVLRDADDRAFIYGTRGLEVPIYEKNGRIVAWGAENRAEDSYNWAVAITPDGGKADVCIYKAVAPVEPDAFASSQWFSAGKEGIMMQGQCPSEKADYPPREIVAG
ncbi:hypothetical protein OK349_11065 [Sphingomonas sp. BT-65]|uniref:hypothetical protein n=1 Tax=Sphingomonas sp. BT-65 TaxID=2989821 RepID=UPI002235BA0A|nr:hypothetical protein [Sphingomonas sp. BT-65]MCW4462247.1 hypothetical protein [Sphingomonas sp. BT-65]